MDVFITRCCLSLLLLTSTIGSSTGSNETSLDETRKPRVSGRIVKLYSGAKPEPYYCTAEGFQPDPKNCAVFYRCVKERSGKFTVFMYQCAPGTVYDPDVEICNHPRSTRRAECGGTKKSVDKSYTTHANEIDIAQSELPRPISTKVPIYTDQTTFKHSTTVPWALTTQTTTTISRPPRTPSVSSYETTKFTSSTTKYPWSSITQRQITEYETKFTLPPKPEQSNTGNDGRCTADGFMGDSENCRKFYRCVGNQRGGFVRYEFTCTELTIWDDEIEGCNHPWAVKRSKCGRSLSHAENSVTQPPGSSSTASTRIDEYLINNGQKNNKTIQQQLQISHGTDIVQTQTQISHSNEVIQNQTQIHYDNHKNNMTFESKQNQTQMSYVSAVSQSQTQIDYGNKGVQTQIQIDHSRDSSQSQVQVQESTTSGLHTSTYTQHAANGGMECTESGFIGDSNDCKKFYRCVNNGRGSYKKFEYVCGDGTVWDPRIEACNHAWAVENCGGKLPSETAIVETTTSTMKPTEHFEPTKTTHTLSTSHTTIDDDNNDIGYGNEINHKTSTTSTTTTEKSSVGISTECMTGGFIGDVNDCKIFYRCVEDGKGGFTKFEFKCGDGTLWDPEIDACNHASAVKHCGIKIPSKPISVETTSATTKLTEYPIEPTKTTQSTTMQTSDVDDSNDIGYGNQINADTSSLIVITTQRTTTTMTDKPNKNNNECATSGFIGDALDCKIFYRCVEDGKNGFTKYEFKCGDGTVWDQEIEACNHAWAVKRCGGGISSNGDNIETTNKEDPAQNVKTTVTLVQITTQSPASNDDYDTGYGAHNDETSVTTIKTTKQPAGQEKSDCKSSGFMGDENDCKKFYRCVDNGNGGYTRHEFTCGEGTVWDAKIEACNHDWAVEKCGGSNTNENTVTTSSTVFTTQSGELSSVHTPQTTDQPVHMTTTATSNFAVENKCSRSGFMGDNSDCKKFYRCVDNGDGSFTRYEFTCGEGTVWDSEIEACNHAWAVDNCGGQSIDDNPQTTSHQPVMQDENEGNGYLTPSYGNSETTQTVKPTSETTETITTNKSKDCKSSGFMGDNNDCKKFYRCVDNGNGGYNRYEFSCGEGTVWDASIEACNHAWAVKDCGASELSTVKNESTTQPPSSSSTFENHFQQSTEGTANTIHHENEITGDKCTQEGFFGSQKDCKKFYRCVDDGRGGFAKYDFSCGEGTSWNQNIQSCDHVSPERPCEVSNHQPPHFNDELEIRTTTKADEQFVEQQNTQTDRPSTVKSQPSKNKCISEGFYGDPLDCKKFYRCVDNGNNGYTKYDFNCGDGTVWNQEIQACDHESGDMTCSSSTTSQTQTNGTQSESTTNSYSSTIKQEFTENVTPSETTSSECTSEGFFAHHNDCKKFIRCVGNGNGGYTKYEFSCGDGTVWVQDIQACDHDNDVTSCRSQTTSGQTQTNHSSGTGASEQTFTSSTESMIPDKEHDEYESGDDKEPSKDDTDVCTSDGYFANKEDCRKFYRCVNNGKGGYTKYDYVCGDSTAWDSDIQTCNHISEVQSCSSSSPEQGTQTENETTTNKNEAGTEGTSSTTKVTTSSSGSSGGSSSIKEDTCESEGYFGNSNDCKKFYRCVDNGKGSYTKYDFTCGEGTIWDQDITTCNHPGDVSNPSCGNNNNQETSDTSSTARSTTRADSTSQTTSSDTNGSGTSSTQATTSQNVTCNKAGYYPNPNDCKKFYRCVDWDGDGKKFSVFHFECGDGTIWDPALDTCNYEESVYPPRDCSESQSQNVGGETITEETTTKDDTTTTTESTTQQSTTEQSTNEPTTTQQSSTTEQTTIQESTTSAAVTTQQSTTSEATTTQQSTTSEETTTTQQSTTSEQTTTEQSTTNEQTTTQQSTTSEKTTTQQSTTSEQTTTQQSTTSEQTTTQQSTTSEQTTTRQSTTGEQTTTEDSSTTEQTTTQQSTTNESTTAQTTEGTTEGKVEQTTEETTEQTTEGTTEKTTEGTTKQTTEGTTEQTTEGTTEQTTEGTTEQTTEGTTERTTEGTTEQTTEGTTEESTAGTTEQSTTELSTTESSTESTDTSSTTESSSSDKECPETDDDQYLLVCPTSFKRHPKYCNMFYQCTEDDETYEAKIATFKCPNNTIYDESQTQCVEENKANEKCDGEIASKKRFKRLSLNYKEPIVADKGKQSCPTTGYFSFEKDSECSKGFLKCEKTNKGQLRGYVYQCPDGYIYWSISKRCELINSVKGCKRSTNDWRERWNIPVERKNIAL